MPCAAPRKRRRPGYVLHAPCRGFRERPWFDALFVFGARPMARRRKKPDAKLAGLRKAVTLDPETWSEVVATLSLTPQQSRIVALILKGHCDKQVAAHMGLCVPTVRTHLSRLFHRIDVNDRVELVLSVFAVALAAWSRRRNPRCPGRSPGA